MATKQARIVSALVLVFFFAVFWEVYVVPRSGNSFQMKAIGVGILSGLSFAVANILCNKYYPGFDASNHGDMVVQAIVAVFILGWFLAGAALLAGSTSVWDALCLVVAVDGVAVALAVPCYMLRKKHAAALQENASPPNDESL